MNFTSTIVWIVNFFCSMPKYTNSIIYIYNLLQIRWSNHKSPNRGAVQGTTTINWLFSFFLSISNLLTAKLSLLNWRTTVIEQRKSKCQRAITLQFLLYKGRPLGLIASTSCKSSPWQWLAEMEILTVLLSSWKKERRLRKMILIDILTADSWLLLSRPYCGWRE